MNSAVFFPLVPCSDTRQLDAGGRSAFLTIAAGLGLGIAARDMIKISDVSLA